ncbi:hypothetical protein RHSIM_Rhsim03G0026000 [Rhododendron simsii]|uniref:Pentatricopeptide repeat-containing protein n=1 Tax=Rhododendron simsii TaxID=118357 RepID=A0A834H6Y4_RHOSS|nr:hypothetical protein RHSIM_Rhsim03G0026000 [Rhododendron simsii]
MLREGLKPNIVTHNSLIGAYASHGVNEEALSIFSEMKKNGFRLDVVSYTSLLNAYRRSEQPKKAREVFHLMKRNNCKPNVVSYNALIDAYGSNGFLAKAFNVLHDMEQTGVHPNIVSICTLLAACGRVGQRVKMILYSQRLKAESTFTMMKVAGCSPDVVTYTTTIHACTSVGDWEKAAALLKEMGMNNVQPDAIAFLAMLQAFNTGCQPAKVMSLAVETRLILVCSHYDEGSHNVIVELSGIWKADFPQHNRVRVAGDRFQKDWSISEVVQRVLGTKHWQDIEGLLNRWVGRFARKNFPVLIRGWRGAVVGDRHRVADKGGVCGSSRGMKAVVNGVMVVVVMWCGDANCGIVRIMGYLSGSSPHIKSGAVSALSVLVHNNAEICLLVPDLVPSVLALLQTKAVEVIKAVLGFIKVLVLCHQAKDLQNILPDIVNEVVRWSFVSRHRFRAKACLILVTVLLEILMRRCGSAPVKLVTPEKHVNFVKGVLENRHGKASSKESSATDMELEVLESSPRRMRWKRKREEPSIPSEGDEIPSSLPELRGGYVNPHRKASSKESSATDMDPEVLESSPRMMQQKRKCGEPSIPSEEDGIVESRFREQGMKPVKKAGICTADRRTKGQPSGNARNKRNFNGLPAASRNTQM